MAFVACLGSLLGGCPPLLCGNDAAISISVVSPASGQNQRSIEITITGGCFDKTTQAFLVNAHAGTITLTIVSVEDTDTLKAQVPAGIPVGAYTVRVVRGAQAFDLANAYHATANIVVSGDYEGKFYVVDVADINQPREIRAVEPWPGQVNRWIYSPTVNYDATRVYFADFVDDEHSGIYGADLVNGGNLERITNTSILHYRNPDASPTEPLITFLGGEEVADVCDIYTVNEDGTGQTKIADHEDMVLINGDNTGSWGLWWPVFSPDGNRIAFIRETVCAGCTNDWYSVVMTMNKDGSNKQVVHWEAQVRFYDHLRWTADNYLIWDRRDSDVSPVEVVALDMNTLNFAHILPPAAQWPEFVYFTCNPSQQGLLMQPFNTSDMVYYPFAAAGANFAASTGIPLNVPDSGNASEFYHHYNFMDWFYWAD